MEKFYNIGIPANIQQIIAVFYKTGLWNTGNERNSRLRPVQFFYFVHFFIFNVLMAMGTMGAYLLNNGQDDESIFLTVVSIYAAVQLYRLYYIIRKQFEIRSLIERAGIHCTNDRNEFIEMDKTLNNFMNFTKYFIFVCVCALICSLISPVVAANDRKLMLNIGFQLYWKHSSAAEFWLASIFITGAVYVSVLCCLFTVILWYVMFSFTIKYKMFANQLKLMGKGRTSQYYEDLMAAIKTHGEINEKIAEFSSTFSNLFLIQIITSSVCICGSTFTLAFSSHNDLLQDGITCVCIGFGLFDIVTLTYLGNEIEVTSDRLSYGIFESNWFDQTQSCKTVILIITEMLRQPQELVVGIVFPLNMNTCTLVIRRAYSLFNVLQNLRN